MIRRLFWVVLGAALGIGGYRRVSRAARVLLPSGGLVGQVGRRALRATRPALAHRASTALTQRASSRSAQSGTAAFVRDVRAGMTEYLDRHRDI
jgi:hypothetical protein